MVGWTFMSTDCLSILSMQRIKRYTGGHECPPYEQQWFYGHPDPESTRFNGFQYDSCNLFTDRM